MIGVTVKKINPVHEDERGVIADLLNKKISHVGLITTEAGAVRGNHYHKESIQYSYILSGKFEVLISPVDNRKKIKKIILNEGELMIIPPNVIHRFKAIERAVMVDMISESREGANYEKDVVRVLLKV